MKKQIIAAVSIFLLFGCKESKRSEAAASKDEAEWIASDKIKQGPIKHDSLPPEVVDHIHSLQKVFAEVDSTPASGWVEDFQRDTNYENELAIWDALRSAYTSFLSNGDRSLDEKKEAYSLLLMRSGSNTDDVLKRTDLKVLSEDSALKLLNSYKLEARPIRIIKK